MDRHVDSVEVTIENGEHLSDAFHFSPFAMGDVHMPEEWTTASIGFHVSSTKTGTFQPKKDPAGDLVQIVGPVASESYGFPPEMAGSLWVKLHSQDGTGSDVSQGGERTIPVDLKA